METQVLNLDYQLISIIALGVVNLLALSKAYHGLKADNRDLASEFRLSIANEKTDRLTVVASAKAELVTAITKVEGYVNDLTHRVTTLESGQDEWTKALRERTHALANDVQTLVVKVAVLEQKQAKNREGT